MERILVPYHLDAHLPELAVPLAVDRTVTAELPAGGPWPRLLAVQRRVRDVVADGVRRDAHPVLLAGDCLVSLGVLAGLQAAGVDPSIVWLDAHGDVQTLETSESGYLGGVPLRIAVGYRPELIARDLGLRPVPERRVLLVDARDLDPPEAQYLRSAEIRRAEVAGLTPDALPGGPLYLHVDADVADAADVPGLRFPAPAGPSLSEVAAAVHRVLGTGRVAAVTFACTWHPGPEPAVATAAAVAAALAGW